VIHCELDFRNYWGNRQIRINVVEVAQVDADAYLIAEYCSTTRASRFLPAGRVSIQRAQRVVSASEFKSGRLNGQKLPEQNGLEVECLCIPADIDYLSLQLKRFTVFLASRCGFQGEIIPGQEPAPPGAAQPRRRTSNADASNLKTAQMKNDE